MLSVLMEQWTSCSGCWSQSEFFLSIKQKRKNRTYGSRRWMCKAEIQAKFGSAEVAQQIIDAKMADPELKKTQVRANKDLHGLDTDDTCIKNANILRG